MNVYLVEIGDVDSPHEELVGIFSTQKKGIAFAKECANEQLTDEFSPLPEDYHLNGPIDLCDTDVGVAILDEDDETIIWWNICEMVVK